MFTPRVFRPLVALYDCIAPPAATVGRVLLALSHLMILQVSGQAMAEICLSRLVSERVPCLPRQQPECLGREKLALVAERR